MTMLDNFRLIAEKVVVWLPDLLVAEAVGQSSLVTYVQAIVHLVSWSQSIYFSFIKKGIVIQYLHLFSLLQQNAIDRGLLHSRNFFLRVPEAGKFKLKHQ